MNIKKAEEQSGVSRQNIRFYEREGLLSPERNAENDYREYGEEHIRILKQIRAMRMLDMPLDQIRLVLAGQLSPAEAAAEQQQRLKRQQAQLAAAIRFCEEWRSVARLEDMDVDMVLSRMEQPENAQGLFQKWREDYRKVVLSESQKVFTFVPDEPVTNPWEFTSALFAYADKNNMDLVVTKEGMHPEFTIDNIEYRAERFYTSVSRVPVAVIRCSVKYPEDFEPDVPEKRKKWMKCLGRGWPLILYMLLFWRIAVGWEGVFSSWEGWLLMICFGLVALMSMYWMQFFHFNEKQ